MKRLVVGVLAHVDSGKTTLSEAMLYRAGAIRKLGRVDHQDAFLDTFALERSRGITIFAKQAVLQLPAAQLTLLDTPGHVDFSAEMERTLQVLDYAVLVISGTSGVQSHTETLWRLLARYHVPTFLFVNKMDLAGADRAVLAAQLKSRFGDGCIDFDPALPPEARGEALALCSEALMGEYFAHGAVTDKAVAEAVRARKVFPCWFGCALQAKGVEALLDGLSRYTLPLRPGAEFGARVFKISQDEQGVRLTFLKVTDGALRVKALLRGTGADGAPWEEKANQLRIYSGAKFTTAQEVLPGEVCAVTGLTATRAGEGLGVQSAAVPPLLEPVLSYRVLPPPEADVHTLLTQLRVLEEEDPALHVLWNPQLSEIHVRLMGEIQLEILQSLIAARFHTEVPFSEGGIVYQETIAAPVEGVGHYEPLRHYAEVHLLLEPGARGSGLVFSTACRTDDLDANWQRLILTHLAEKQHCGALLGAPITDMKLTLIAGRAHPKHTEGGDFRQATYRAVRQGLRSAESVLLEPWYTYRLAVPEENVGRALADLQRKGAEFSAPVVEDGAAVLCGAVPVATMRGYARELASYTRGRGSLGCTLEGYRPCHNTEEVVAAAAYDADADTANSADSIFCAHGAGVLVKWDEAPEKMHIQTHILQAAPEDEPEDTPRARAARRQRAADYCSQVVLDKELLQIFERTYGALKKEPSAAFRSTKRPEAPVTAHAKPLPAGPEYLLVDGYNVIFAWDELRALAAENLDAARRRLMDILCNYKGYRRCEVILVFDAYKVKNNPGAMQEYHGISVVYTREAETADMYIERVTHNLGREHRVRVATSDGAEQMIILGHGALRLPALALQAEVAQAEAEIRAYLSAP